jgi:hypothetical protein
MTENQDGVRDDLLDEMTQRALDDEGFRREAQKAPDRRNLNRTLVAHGYEELYKLEKQRINAFREWVKPFSDEQLVRQLHFMLHHPTEMHRH